MMIDANLLTGLEIGVGLGALVGIFIGACLLYALGKYVTLPW